MDKVAGIVLAGGRSTRMGTSKAFLCYKNLPLVEYMRLLLRQAGLRDVYVSGSVDGYACIPDAVRYAGPACAIRDLLRQFRGQFEKLLFVPVDMPLIPVAALQALTVQGGSVFYKDCALPACLMTEDNLKHCCTVKEALSESGARALDLPREWQEGMANINTLEEWKALIS